MIVNSLPGRTATLAVVLAASGSAALAASGAPMQREKSFVVSAPRDGALIHADALFSWVPVRDAASYAVLVDASIPSEGAVVMASDRVVTVATTSVRLTLGPATSGSPSARDFHSVVVLPLDDQGRRLGRAAAVVHVRDHA